MAIIGNKYGYRPLPVRIDHSEFQTLVKNLEEQGEYINDLKTFYLLDENNCPPLCVLKPRDDSISKDEWYKISTEMQRKFQLVANILRTEDRDKYFISVTEQEIVEGLISNEKRDKQTLMVKRHLRGVRSKHHATRRLIDMVDEEIDDEAQNYLLLLKQNKIQHLQGQGLEIIDREYEENKGSALECVKDTCEKICKNLVNMILRTYEEDLHREKNPVIDEIIQNMRFLNKKSRILIGRDRLLKTLSDKVLSESGEMKSVLVIHGTSGVGKTAFVAHVAKLLKTEIMTEVCLVVRFMGTTSSSGNVYNLLVSVVTQILLIYGQYTSQIPANFDELIEFFQWCLSLSTVEKPLMLLLDSIEHIYQKDSGENLKWLPLEMAVPRHTYIIVSATPGECLNILSSHLPRSSLFEIPHLPSEAASLILSDLLEKQSRTITKEQRETLMEAYELNPFPLYMQMLVDRALTWRSYDIITTDSIASGVAGMTSLLFERLEGRYGKTLVHHALAYITASKAGLSETELEDILSCDDEVLDEVFDFWMPPIRRLPPSLWIRIRADLRLYLMEKGSDGVIVYSWYHKQCRQMAATRYLHKSDPPFIKQAHQAIADYFDEKWLRGKEWTPKAKSRTVKDLTPRIEDRRVI